MASILDLAVVALAVMVCISMILLAWTLGVSITGVLGRMRASLISARLDMAVAERRLRSTARSMADAQVEAAKLAEGDG